MKKLTDKQIEKSQTLNRKKERQNKRYTVLGSRVKVDRRSPIQAPTYFIS